MSHLVKVSMQLRSVSQVKRVYKSDSRLTFIICILPGSLSQSGRAVLLKPPLNPEVHLTHSDFTSNRHCFWRNGFDLECDAVDLLQTILQCYVNPFSATDNLWQANRVSYEMVNVHFDNMDEMHHWDNEFAAECLLLGECLTYELWDMISPSSHLL